jgi:foldase protein PrsA
VEFLNNLLKQKNIQILIAALLVVILAGAILFSNRVLTAKKSEEVVARVNGEAISKAELNKLLEKQYGQEALDLLISEKVIDLELKKRNIAITEEDVNKELQEIIQQYGGQEEFDKALVSYGYTADNFKKDIESNLKVEKLLEPEIKISEEDMKAYFDSNKDTFDVKEQVKASHILVDTEEKAQEVKKGFQEN